jgi:hypothetical protein
MFTIKINNYEFIEIVIPSGSNSSRWYFEDQPQLRFAILDSIEFYSYETIQTSILSNTEVLNNNSDQAGNFYLVLYCNDREDINRIPLRELGTTNEQYLQYLRNIFAGQQIIWAKSYIEYAGNYADLENDTISVPFGIYYR